MLGTLLLGRFTTNGRAYYSDYVHIGLRLQEILKEFQMIDERNKRRFIDLEEDKKIVKDDARTI